jgi:hypothetical protein
VVVRREGVLDGVLQAPPTQPAASLLAAHRL